jgi:hypothetical protein
MIGTIIRIMDHRPFRGRCGPEDQLAIEVANFLRAATLEGRLAGTWTHIPHEVGGAGIKAKVLMALAKAMGLIKGSGDYVFVWEGGGGWIELKSSTGSLSPAQRDFRDWCQSQNVNWAKCKTIHEVINNLVEWGALHHPK